MAKSLSVLPTYRIQKTFGKNHRLNKKFEAFYSTVGRRKYLIRNDGTLTIKRVPSESLDFGGLSNSKRWTFASGKIVQKANETSVDLIVRPQQFISNLFNIAFLILLFFVVLTALTAKPAGAIMLFVLLLFLGMPWYLMLKSGLREFKEELEKDMDSFR